MEIRRPVAALFTALTLFGGGATMTGCAGTGQDQNDGTTDEAVGGLNPEDADRENMPDAGDPAIENKDDRNDDAQDPD